MEEIEDQLYTDAKNQVIHYLKQIHTTSTNDKKGNRAVKKLMTNVYEPIIKAMIQIPEVSSVLVNGENITSTLQFTQADALVQLDDALRYSGDDDSIFACKVETEKYAKVLDVDPTIDSIIVGGFNTGNLDNMIRNFQDIAQRNESIDNNDLPTYEPSFEQESQTKDLVEISNEPKHYDVQEIVQGMQGQFEVVLHDMKEQHTIELNDYKRANRKNLVALGVLGIIGLSYLGYSNAKLSDEVKDSNNETKQKVTAMKEESVQTLSSVSQTATDLATSSQARIDKTTSTAQLIMSDSYKLRKKLRETMQKNDNDMNDLFDLMGTQAAR